MPYGVNTELAEASVRLLGNNVRLINWFKEVEEKTDTLTGEIEKKLGDIDNYMKNRKYNEAIDSIEYQDLLKTLRASKRSEYGKVRDSLIWLVGQILRLKRMPKEDRPIRAIINMFEVFRNLYTILINEHVENTTMIEDKIVFQIERMTTDSARIYDLGTRPFIESEEMQDGVRNAVAKESDREKSMTKVMKLQPQGLDGILA